MHGMRIESRHPRLRMSTIRCLTIRMPRRSVNCPGPLDRAAATYLAIKQKRLTAASERGYVACLALVYGAESVAEMRSVYARELEVVA